MTQIFTWFAQRFFENLSMGRCDSTDPACLLVIQTFPFNSYERWFSFRLLSYPVRFFKAAYPILKETVHIGMLSNLYMVTWIDMS